MEITNYLSYDNIIVVRYPNNAGGKFLINCLGLSNQVVLQDNKLAELQVNKLLPPAEKFSILLDKLNNVTDTWLDLNLGCSQLFRQAYFAPYGKMTVLDPVIKLVIEKKLHLCLVAHDDQLFQSLLTTWPNAKIIYLTNYNLFINKYRSFAAVRYKKLTQLLHTWSTEKKQHWPELPPSSIHGLQFFPKEVVDELYSGQYNHIIDLIFDEEQQNQKYQAEIKHINFLSSNSKWVESFDAGCYLDCGSVVKEVGRIYQALNLTDFNKECIKQYYEKWIQILSQIQNKTLTKSNN